jgi:hypothetical protein
MGWAISFLDFPVMVSLKAMNEVDALEWQLSSHNVQAR